MQVYYADLLCNKVYNSMVNKRYVHKLQSYYCNMHFYLCCSLTKLCTSALAFTERFRVKTNEKCLLNSFLQDNEKILLNILRSFRQPLGIHVRFLNKHHRMIQKKLVLSLFIIRVLKVCNNLYVSLIVRLLQSLTYKRHQRIG